MLREKMPSSFAHVFGESLSKSLHMDVFKTPDDPDFLIDLEERKLKPDHPDVEKMVELIAPVMFGYVEQGKYWDPQEIALIVMSYNNFSTFVSLEKTGDVIASYNVQVERFNDKPVIASNSIIVDNRYRGHQLATRMLNQAMEYHKPVLVAGSTNSGVAALSRSRILRQKGYVTMLGGKVISGIEHKNDKNVQALHEQWLVNENLDTGSDIPVKVAPFPLFKDSDIPTAKPEGMHQEEWENLLLVLNTVAQEQSKHREKDGSKTALIQAPLVSIKLGT